MIKRHWKGITFTDMADAYEQHLHEDTLPVLRDIKGFRGMQILRREVESGIEFLILTSWDSLESIRAFAGDEYELAVVPQKAEEMMVSFDERVTHYVVSHDETKS